MMRPAYVQRMARYNRWQNENLYTTADRLSDSDRRRDRGVFFQSIHGTLSHILWADDTWMSRFCNEPRPPGNIGSSASLFPDWGDLKSQRAAMDRRIIAWSDAVRERWLSGDISWFSGSVQRD